MPQVPFYSSLVATEKLCNQTEESALAAVTHGSRPAKRVLATSSGWNRRRLMNRIRRFLIPGTILLGLARVATAAEICSRYGGRLNPPCCCGKERVKQEGYRMENRKRKIEVFSAGCPACEDTIAMVNAVACLSCEVEVLDMRQPAIAARATGYGIRRVPAVVIDGKLASCCAEGGPDQAALRKAGLGVPL
jgi:glutaredoxin 3